MSRRDPLAVSRHLVFYGTLMSDMPTRSGAPDLSSHVEFIAPCQLSGTLYDVGAYPGLLAGYGRVYGELWQINSQAALTLIDKWEEYNVDNEKSSLYIRRPIWLEHEQLWAWTYYYNRPVADLELIESGDWRAQTATG